MDKKIGEVFEHNGVTLITIEDKNNNGCKGCYFFNSNICIVEYDQHIPCSALCRDDNKSVIFRKVEDMESRTIKLTLEKAKEFYKKGGELKELALSAFTKEELEKKELPKTWEEFCKSCNIQLPKEYFIDSHSDIVQVPYGYERDTISDKNILPSEEAAKAHLALMQLHQLRDCYRQGWKPDWENTDLCKYSIVIVSNTPKILPSYSCNCFLSFQSKEIAEEFLKNFRGLIEQAGDLI